MLIVVLGVMAVGWELSLLVMACVVCVVCVVVAGGSGTGPSANMGMVVLFYMNVEGLVRQ